VAPAILSDLSYVLDLSAHPAAPASSGTGAACRALPGGARIAHAVPWTSAGAARLCEERVR
jgi:hypothetical protein